MRTLHPCASAAIHVNECSDVSVTLCIVTLPVIWRCCANGLVALIRTLTYFWEHAAGGVLVEAGVQDHVACKQRSTECHGLRSHLLAPLR